MVVLLGLIGAYVGSSGQFDLDLEDLNQLGLPSALIWTVGLILYFSAFILWGVLRHVFLTLPLMRHYAETLAITGVSGLLAVRQTDRDRFAEAEGFAEALDIGAAI